MQNAYQTALEKTHDPLDLIPYLNACTELMDDQIRENLHANNFEDDLEFLSAYCDTHLIVFGKEFIVN